jgi:hypothetical protein
MQLVCKMVLLCEHLKQINFRTVEIPDYPDHENIRQFTLFFLLFLHEKDYFMDHSPVTPLIKKVSENQYEFFHPNRKFPYESMILNE